MVYRMFKSMMQTYESQLAIFFPFIIYEIICSFLEFADIFKFWEYVKKGQNVPIESKLFHKNILVFLFK